MGNGVDPETARKGILRYLQKQGGSVPMGLLHGHSKLMYQAAHQAFSQLMEGLVADGLVVFEDDSFRLTDGGRALLAQES